MWYLIVENVQYGSFVMDEGQYSKIKRLYDENVEAAKSNPRIANVRMVKAYE
jgi:hypothetical protein